MVQGLTTLNDLLNAVSRHTQMEVLRPIDSHGHADPTLKMGKRLSSSETQRNTKKSTRKNRKDNVMVLADNK